MMLNNLPIIAPQLNNRHTSLSLDRSWVEIDLNALRLNLNVIKRYAGQAKIIAVLKANAYQHGIKQVANVLHNGVAIFAVTNLTEALKLKQTAHEKQILLLSPSLPCEYATIAYHRFIPTFSSLEEIQYFAEIANHGSLFHLKIDTGMGRLGISPDEAVDIVRFIQDIPLSLHSISTHLSSADNDHKHTIKQISSYKKLINRLHKLIPNVPIHLLNSAGLFLYPEYIGDFVRVGLALYGISTIPVFQHELIPVLTWKTFVTLVKTVPSNHKISYGGTYTTRKLTRIAVIAVGYADGYPYQLSSNGASVLIQGQKVPILGKVTMDQIIVDVTELESVKSGEEVVLIGEQGNERITALELAKKAHTIPWHIFCGITERVRYHYI